MKIINFILYGNFFIALCAAAQTIQSFFFLENNCFYPHILPVFVWASTFFLYNIHKPITYFLKKQLVDNQRFLKTKAFSTPLSILTILAGLGCLFLFFQLKTKTQLSLSFAAILSLAYVIPIFGQKRLRDLPFIKIFTIAFVWAFVVIILPLQELGKTINTITIILFMEKAFFVFALTIPFDIRDVDWDAKTNVKTIPLSIGIQNAKSLAILCLIGSIVFVFLLH